MNIENEITVLNVNKQQLITSLKNAGAKQITEELKQVRYVYDFKPKNKNKWIRLRSNGKKTTLAIKEVTNSSKLNTKEYEVEVSDIETTNEILEQLGYTYRNRQENLRQIFELDGAEISIDSWPMIPPYAEIEAKDLQTINKVVEKLGLDKNNITTLDVCSIYKNIYNIDILEITDLKFE